MTVTNATHETCDHEWFHSTEDDCHGSTYNLRECQACGLHQARDRDDAEWEDS